MRRTALSLALVLCFLFCGSYTLEVSADEIVPNYKYIRTLRVQSLSPLTTEHEAYNYTTDKYTEITCIAHLLNSFDVIKGKVPVVSDGNALLIEFEYMDNSTVSIDMFPGGIRKTADDEYIFSHQEYNQFVGFVHTLKTGKLILPIEIAFTPSEWARVYVDSAIDSGLVPKLNQINYTRKIARLEICQLVANLLKTREYIAVESTGNPFEDISDESVIMLYNAGVIDGKTETEFCPYDFITREELAKILLNVYTLISDGESIPDVQSSYTDSTDISEWALDSVKKMTSLGIFIGDENGDFRPHDNTTKEQVIVTLLRVFNLSGEPTGDVPK